METNESKEIKVPKELDELFYQVGTYNDSADYNSLLDFVKKFPQIAPYNALLLHIQKPGSQYVATPQEWKERFNRYIKPGARPLIILWPFGPVRFVFELGDTDGPDHFPEKLLKPFETNGQLSPDKFKRLISNLSRIGVSYHEADHGTSSAGFIELANPRVQVNINDKLINIFCHLVVNKNHSREEKFATIAHELGHLHCGHLGLRIKGFCPDRSHLDRQTQEFEAESVSWIVCERAGIHSPSARYLNGYMDENKKIPHISLETVFKTAGLIESMLEHIIPWRDKILVKEISKKTRTRQGSLI